MDDDRIVPGPGPEAKEPRPGEPELLESWLECLGEAIRLRESQEFLCRLKTAPELRQSAQDMGPLAGEFGFESPVLFRAIGALITMCHPLVLLAAFAGIPTSRPARVPSRVPAAARHRARGGRS